MTPVPEAIPNLEVDGQLKRRRRSLAIALALGAMAILFYLATLVRVGEHISQRTL